MRPHRPPPEPMRALSNIKAVAPKENRILSPNRVNINI